MNLIDEFIELRKAIKLGGLDPEKVRRFVVYEEELEALEREMPLYRDAPVSPRYPTDGKIAGLRIHIIKYSRPTGTGNESGS